MNVEVSDPSDPFDPKRSGGTGSREEAFWERYRQVLRTARVEDGVAVWYRWHVEGFIRFLKPRRLREASEQGRTTRSCLEADDSIEMRASFGGKIEIWVGVF